MSSKKLLIVIGVLVLINVILITTVIVGFFYTKSIIDDSMPVNSTEPDTKIHEISIYELITSPEEYHNKKVRVIGASSVKFESTYIAPYQDDIYYCTDNKIWLDIGYETPLYNETEKYDGEYVIIEGTFDKDRSGFKGQYRGAIKDITRFESWNINIMYNSAICGNKDGTYSYTITDYNGWVLDSVKNTEDILEKQIVTTDVIGLTHQTGTKLSTRQTTYYDLKNSKVSEKFTSVLAAQSSYVIYADYFDEKQYVVVQSIFDKSEYYAAYEITNTALIGNDFDAECELQEDRCAVITYLSEDGKTKTDMTIYFPNKKAE